jgi:hypothetical protein
MAVFDLSINDFNGLFEISAILKDGDTAGFLPYPACSSFFKEDASD